MEPASILVVVTLLILTIALPLLSLWTGKRLRAPAAAPLGKFLRYARTIAVLWSLTALALYALRLHHIDPMEVGLRAPHSPWEMAAGLIVLVAPVLGSLSGARRVLDGSYARALRAVVPDGTLQWVAFIPVAASAGLCEEFLYRGYALTIVSGASGSLFAGVAASSVAFGIAHAYQGRIGVIGATITGFFYAAVFVATGSLYPCMLGHFVQDIVGASVLSRRLRDDDALRAQAEGAAG